MRLPRDVQDAIDETMRGKPVYRGPGGKVLRRLQLFEEQRGIEMASFAREIEPGEAGEEKKEKGKKLTGEDIARLYIEGARALEEGGAAESDIEEGGAEAPAAPSPAPAPPAAPPPRWRPLGPVRIPKGQTYGSKRIDVSGRVAAIAIDPASPGHILCGAAAGGIWESRNTGRSWSPRTDRMATLATGAIAFDPVSTSIVYAGTGEGNFYARLGAGLLRSTNGGATWSLLADAPFVGQGFYDISIDPNNTTNLLAATTGGLYKSTDSGRSWTRRRSQKTWKISRAGGDSPEILAASSDGLKVSTNNGQTWAAVALPGAPSAWNRLAVDHVRARPEIAYAFGASGDTAYLYRRDGRGVWHRLPTPSDLSTGQAWYDWFVAAAPDREGQVYLGAIHAHRGDLSGGTWTWTNISSKTSGDSIHPDQHAIAFDPTNPAIVYIGNDGGLYRSTDRGISWRSLNTNLAITEMEYIAQDPGSYRWLMGGTQDNGTIRFRGGPVWDHIADGDGGDCAVNSINPDSVFHSYYGMGLQRSDNRGDTWGGFIQNGRNRPGYRALFYPPMEGRGNTIAQAGQSVFISRDNGATWTEIALAGNPVASAMHMPTPDLVFVGTTDGRIFRIRWRRGAWSAATELTRPRTAWISDLHAHPRNTNRLWATSSSLGGGRVFRSDDGGSTWTDRTDGLPGLPVNAVEVDPGNANRVWVAADVGVYQSFNGGVNWRPFANGLPNVLVADLLYHPLARVLRAGTRNRGVWEIDVNGPLAKPICGRQWTGSLGPRQSRRWFTFNWPATWHMVWTVMPTSVRRGAPQLTWDVAVERADAEHVTYWITVRNLTDTTVRFEGRYCILSFH